MVLCSEVSWLEVGHSITQYTSTRAELVGSLPEEAVLQ